MSSQSESYKQAGVDITAGYAAVDLMKRHIARTTREGCVSDIGGFGGLFEPNLTGIKRPILVSGTDGVGTKLKIAFLMDKHDTVGIDCVAMCVNDIICSGARPLFFLDYIACGKLVPARAEQIVSGVCEGCVQAGCALVGGETAEMPGFYPENEYDLAGFSVGLADGENMIDPSSVGEGDVIIGLASSGVHSNGFSLVRKVLHVDTDRLSYYSDSLGMTVGEALLAPTKIYVKDIMSLIDGGIKPHAVAHITGGGFYENIPRALPDGISVRVKKSVIKTPPIFDLIASTGNIPERDMFNTFNMGVGMAVAVASEDADRALKILTDRGEDAYILGETVKSEDGVIFE